jgi:hypothetical protein
LTNVHPESLKIKGMELVIGGDSRENLLLNGSGSKL